MALVNVLDSLNRCDPLEIDVVAIFSDEVRAVRHYSAIVNLLSIDLECSSCITTIKKSIRVFRKSSLISERLWKVQHFFISWSMQEPVGLGTMDYEFLDQLKKLWLGVWIRELCRKKAIYVLRSAEFAFRWKIINVMSIEKTMLLELIGVADVYTLSKTVILHNIIHTLLSLCMENTADDIWIILWLLFWKQSSLDLWPMWICSHGQKEVNPTVEITIYSESILTGGLYYTDIDQSKFSSMEWE